MIVILLDEFSTGIVAEDGCGVGKGWIVGVIVLVLDVTELGESGEMYSVVERSMVLVAMVLIRGGEVVRGGTGMEFQGQRPVGGMILMFIPDGNGGIVHEGFPWFIITKHPTERHSLHVSASQGEAPTAGIWSNFISKIMPNHAQQSEQTVKYIIMNGTGKIVSNIIKIFLDINPCLTRQTTNSKSSGLWIALVTNYLKIIKHYLGVRHSQPQFCQAFVHLLLSVFVRNNSVPLMFQRQSTNE